MDFFNLNLSDENLILPTILTFITSVLILYLTLVITEQFKNKISKKRRAMYIKFLRRYNQKIKKCILDFENPKLSEQIIYMVLGSFLGFSLTLVVFLGFSYVLNIDVWRSMAYSSLVNVLSYILTIELTRYIRREERILLDNSNRIECWFKGIKFFIIPSNLVIILYIYLSVSLINYSIIPVSASEKEEIRFIYIISLTIIVITVFFLKMTHEEFLDKIKSKLNTKYLNEFPFVHITTDNREITGKIQDIFDEDVVILDDNGLKMVIEWNTIVTLGLKK